ncbi:hypothetical protein DM01DRAFT_1338341 [Hesseltinella vesiculosa]|uniref:CUE domain-containing protein n=1 Tax=Hesseltinella vesiculosa TaxID=101127 RepID=A0A1X2GAK4_9FUNG|nr:hypothetical protein DM01DRAFT_1338341 [Hesseltinella vesiculosa]
MSDNEKDAKSSTVNINAVDVSVSPSAPPAEEAPQQQQQEHDQTPLPPNIATLKEAFPAVDTDIITAILDSHDNHLERAFDDLLQLSDPTVQQERSPAPPPRPAMAQDGLDAPPMPPRPPLSAEEQMRMDEDFARQLALEDERDRVRLHQQQRQQQQQQQQPEEDSMDDFFKDIQEELPIIKEKMIEAGQNAKKKVMEFYNQIKANRNNNVQTTSSSFGGPRSANTQYHGLPSGNDDDYLLSGDMSALHLSDQEVYSRTQQHAKDYYDYQPSNPAPVTLQQPVSVHNAPAKQDIDAQISADEEFARQLARDDEVWQQQQQQRELQPPVMPPRKSPSFATPTRTSPTVIVSPKSALEEYDERDNQEPKPAQKEDKKEEDERVQSYVIGDDDSDDGLVDLDDDEEELPPSKSATDKAPDSKKKPAEENK